MFSKYFTDKIAHIPSRFVIGDVDYAVAKQPLLVMVIHYNILHPQPNKPCDLTLFVHF